MLNEFKKGQPITAKDLNAIVQSVVRLLNITGNGGIAVTKNANGFSILAESSRHFLTGTLTKDLPFGKAGVVRITEPDSTTSEADLPTADDEAEPEDVEAFATTNRYEWAINYVLEGGQELVEGTAVVCIRRNGWWVIIASSPCPQEDDGE